MSHELFSYKSSKLISKDFVSFSKVKLKIDIGPFLKGSEFEEARIDYVQFFLYIFDNGESFTFNLYLSTHPSPFLTKRSPLSESKVMEITNGMEDLMDCVRAVEEAHGIRF